MTLKRLYLSSLAIIMLVAVAINGWHIHRVTENVRTQFGEAAFQVTKSTVESMLANQFKVETLVFSSTHRSSMNTAKDTTFKKTQVVPVAQTNRIEQSIDLALKDQQNSRSISLTRGATVFDIPIPRTQVEQSLTDARYEILLSSFLIFGVSLFFYFWLTKKITLPIKHISDASQLIGAGQFGVKVKTSQGVIGRELSNLVESINKMSQHLLQLEQQKKQLQEQKTTGEISDITRGLAHSIRNPLHTISLATELTPSSEEEYEKQRVLIKQQINRIDKHIKNLMVITTHESLVSETVDLKQLIHEVVMEMKTQFNDINFKFLASECHEISCLPSELYPIFQTLVSNACEACETTNTKNVKIMLNNQKGSVEIKIVDSGCGLKEDIQNNLFLPHNTNKPYGAGMGLYIASKVIKGRYNGSLLYREHSPGSEFIITLMNRVVD